MSEILVIHCDYKDGECLEEFNGFDPNAKVNARNEILREEGWGVNGSYHLCPKHKVETNAELIKRIRKRIQSLCGPKADLEEFCTRLEQQQKALDPIREWYDSSRSDLEILTDAIADLQTDRAKVLEQQAKIEQLRKAVGQHALKGD